MQHYRFRYVFSLRVIIASLFAAVVMSLLQQHVAFAADPTYTIEPSKEIEATGGFLTDTSGETTPVFVKSGSGWKLTSGQPSDASSYVNISKPSVIFKYVGGNTYSTHVNYTYNEILVSGPGGPETVCYVAIKQLSSTSAEFVGVDYRDRTSQTCTDVVKDSTGLSSLNFATATIKGETLLGVTIPTCTQSPGTSAYSTCISQRRTALSQLDGKVGTTCSSSTASQNCVYYTKIAKCLKQNVTRKVAYCKQLADAEAILSGDLSSITANTTDEEIQAVCNKLTKRDSIEKCIKSATERRDELAGEESVAETSCSIDNIGWLLCPVMNFSAKVVDYSYGWIANLLSVTPVTTTGGGTALYTAWTAVRNIANAAFVVMFLIIIYSQITGAGLTNYGIKKILPKLVVAAILVNASYWICAIAVDISNILGNSLYTLFNGGAISKGIDLSQFDGDISSQGNGWTGLVAAVLGSTAVYLALPALLPALVGALVAVVTVFLVLTLRQVLIILLIVISPLAFVALLLPNTEEWFKRWRGLFQTLLLMYPIIAVIFGASKLASDIVTASATDVNGDGKVAIQIMGALITILPLALTPIIMKISGGVLNRFAGMVNNPNKGPFDRLRKKADSTSERMRNQRTASSLERGRKVGNWARRTRIGSRLKNSNSRVAARALNTVDFAASGGATGKVNAAERDKYAKVLADAGARNYTAKRALASEAYAADLAGGDAKTAVLVQSYAQKAVREEDRKDIEAIREKIGDTATTDFVKKMQSSSDGHEMAAYAAEIAKRGPGRQFHEALEASRYIVDDDHRRLVQSELINNMREDHLGVSDSMRGQLAVGDLKDDAVIKNDDGSERLNGKGKSFDKIYEASMDLRMEKKMSADYVVGMKPHDMTTAQEMMESGEISDGALQSMIDNMLAAESNDNTAVKIKDETKKMFDTARIAAQKRGLTAKMPTPQAATTSTSSTSGGLVTSVGTPPPGSLPPGPGQPPTAP